MEWWVVEIIAVSLLGVIVMVLGQLIKRFGKGYVADVFRPNPRSASHPTLPSFTPRPTRAFRKRIVPMVLRPTAAAELPSYRSVGLIIGQLGDEAGPADAYGGDYRVTTPVS